MLPKILIFASKLVFYHFIVYHLMYWQFPLEWWARFIWRKRLPNVQLSTIWVVSSTYFRVQMAFPKKTASSLVGNSESPKLFFLENITLLSICTKDVSHFTTQNIKRHVIEGQNFLMIFTPPQGPAQVNLPFFNHRLWWKASGGRPQFEENLPLSGIISVHRFLIFHMGAKV